MSWKSRWNARNGVWGRRCAARRWCQCCNAHLCVWNVMARISNMCWTAITDQAAQILSNTVQNSIKYTIVWRHLGVSGVHGFRSRYIQSIAMATIHLSILNGTWEDLFKSIIFDATAFTISPCFQSPAVATEEMVIGYPAHWRHCRLNSSWNSGTGRLAEELELADHGSWVRLSWQWRVYRPRLKAPHRVWVPSGVGLDSLHSAHWFLDPCEFWSML